LIIYLPNEKAERPRNQGKKCLTVKTWQEAVPPGMDGCINLNQFSSRITRNRQCQQACQIKNGRSFWLRPF
jgi:hypothetical protein